jgi:hypothetical protein
MPVRQEIVEPAKSISHVTRGERVEVMREGFVGTVLESIENEVTGDLAPVFV